MHCLTATVYELSASVKLLIESQKSLTSLLESRIEHTVEINYIKKTMADALYQTANLNNRTDHLEKSSFFSQSERTGRSRFIAGIKDYWAVIAIAATATASFLYSDLELTQSKDNRLISSLVSKK